MSEPKRCRDCINCWNNSNMVLSCLYKFWSGVEVDGQEKLTEFSVIDMMAETCGHYGPYSGPVAILLKRMEEKHGRV